MSNNYSVLIKIDQAHVAQFNSQGYRLCFASGVTNDRNKSADEAQYNVIAYTQTTAANVSVNWQESYGIAATTSSFQNGVQFIAATDIAPIKFGQSYELPANWTNGNVNNDSDAPQTGFIFTNKTKSAAAVVYKKIQGQWSPVYISKNAPLPPGKETLVPKVCCAIWFSADADTGNMTSSFSTDPIILDLTNNSSGKAQVSYQKDGTWRIDSNN